MRKRYWFLALLLTCFYLIPHPLFGLRINRTKSVPYRLFVATQLKDQSRGTFVALKHDLSQVLLVKKVMGIAGDPIEIKEQHVFVAGSDCGELLTVSPSGMSLTPVAQGIIPEGYVFVHSPHKNSFDSRYVEFGLVASTQLKEKLWPIF